MISKLSDQLSRDLESTGGQVLNPRICLTADDSDANIGKLREMQGLVTTCILLNNELRRHSGYNYLFT